MSYSSVVLADNPIGYWRLGEAAGTTADNLGNGGATIDGTYVGAPTLGVAGAITGDADTAVTFNGTSQYVSIPIADPYALNVGDVFTIEAWVSRGATGAERAIFSFNYNMGCLIVNATGNLEIQKSGVSIIATSTAAVSTGWRYVVATKSGADVHLYIDGTEDTGTVTNATCVNNGSVKTIGSDGIAGTYFNGSIDEVAVYSSVLTSAQIAAHWAAANATTDAPAGLATGTGLAYDTQYVAAGLAEGTGLAHDLTAITTTQGRAFQANAFQYGAFQGGDLALAATGTGTGHDPTVTVSGTKVYPELAIATGAAYQPTVTIVETQTQAHAGLAAGSGTAYLLPFVPGGIPIVTIRIDFDGDGSFSTAGNDVTADVLADSVSWTFGRNADFTGDVIGQASFTLRNDDGRYTPLGDLLPGRPVHIAAIYSGVSYPLFFGYIERVRMDAVEKMVKVTCYDLFGKMSRVEQARPAERFPLARDEYRRLIAQGMEASASAGKPLGNMIESGSFETVQYGGAGGWDVGAVSGATATTLTGTDTFSQTFSGTLMAGDTVVVSLGLWSGCSVSSVTDTVGTVYTAVAEQNSIYPLLPIVYTGILAATPLTSVTVSVKISSSSLTSIAMSTLVFRGLGALDPLGKTYYANLPMGGAMSTLSTTSTRLDTIRFGVCAGGTATAWPSGYTHYAVAATALNGVHSPAMDVEYQYFTTAGAHDVGWTMPDGGYGQVTALSFQRAIPWERVTASGLATMNYSTTQAKYGSASLRVLLGTATPPWGVYCYPGGINGLAPSAVFDLTKSYTYSLWIYPAQIAESFTVYFGSTSAGMSNTRSVTLPSGVWTEITGTWTPASTGTKTDVVLRITTSGNGYFYLDGVTLFEGTTRVLWQPDWMNLAAEPSLMQPGQAITGNGLAPLSALNAATGSAHSMRATMTAPFYSYATATLASYTGAVSVETFDDDVAEMTDAELVADETYRGVTVTSGALTATAISSLAYGYPVTFDAGTAHADGAGLQAFADYLRDRHEQPLSRPRMTVVNRFPSMLQRVPNELVTVNYARLGITGKEYMIASVSTSISRGGNWWETTYQLEEFPF